jgi:response regulator RpfG family c-di-GMP phosphodiesterase
MRLLLVDDDPLLRQLVRTTLEVADVLVEEAESAGAAAAAIAERPPDAIVLDVTMPGMDGLEFCRRLKGDRATSGICIVLLTGSELADDLVADVGADAFLLKPFSPLELLSVVERLAGGLDGVPFRPARGHEPEEQLLLYARDLRHLLELERGQRLLLQSAYRETVGALASALEVKDTGTRAHSQRVQLYASRLALTIEPRLVHQESTEYGFLLHDVGKIGIPDEILLKPRPLTASEQRLMRTHPVLGEQLLGGVAFLRGECLRVVRSHHERWDGQGYPDGLAGDAIPLGARVFAVADTLDAITTDRPYRRARPWEEARTVVLAESGGQFDPAVVDAFRSCERDLFDIRRSLAAA